MTTSIKSTVAAVALTFANTEEVQEKYNKLGARMELENGGPVTDSETFAKTLRSLTNDELALAMAVWDLMVEKDKAAEDEDNIFALLFSDPEFDLEGDQIVEREVLSRGFKNHRLTHVSADGIRIELK